MWSIWSLLVVVVHLAIKVAVVALVVCLLGFLV